LRVDSLLAIEGSGHLAEGIVAEFADEAYFRSGAGCSHGLVGAFAAGAQVERLAHTGLAPGGKAVDAEGEVGDIAAHNGDTLVCHSVFLFLV